MKIRHTVSQAASKPLLRFFAIILTVGMIDCVFLSFAAKPLPGAVIIPAAIPLLVAAIVIPAIRKPRN